MDERILVEALRVVVVSEEVVEAVELAGVGVVVPGSEVLLAGEGVGLFAAVEERGGGVFGEKTEVVAVGVVVEDLLEAGDRGDGPGGV